MRFSGPSVSTITTLLIGMLLAMPCVSHAQNLAPSGAQASDGREAPAFYGDRERGYYWYEDPKDLPPPKTAPVQPQKNTELKKQPGTVEWLREQMPILLDAAINNPSKENVETYLYAQRVAMDKSQRYAQASQKVVANDPLLDENNRVPLSAFAKVNFLQANDAAKDQALSYLGTVAGLWLVFDSK